MGKLSAQIMLCGREKARFTPARGGKGNLGVAWVAVLVGAGIMVVVAGNRKRAEALMKFRQSVAHCSVVPVLCV